MVNGRGGGGRRGTKIPSPAAPDIVLCGSSSKTDKAGGQSKQGSAVTSDGGLTRDKL